MRFKQGHCICIAMLFLLITSYSFGLKTKTSMKTKIRNNEHHISKLNDNKKVNIESAKEKESINQSVQPQLLDKNTKSDLLDWNNIKKVLVSHQVIILYCTCIIILTSLLLIMFKSLKVILYTNKYNEKDLFSARKLFKSKDGEASKSRTKFGAISNAAKEHQQELADTESCGFKHSCGTINEESESDQLTSNQRGSCSINSHIDGERVQGVQRRNHLERKTNDEPEILSCFSIDKSDDFAIMPRKYIKPNFEEKRDKRVEYYKEREKAIFGYDDKEEDFPNFKIKQRKPKKEDKGIKNFTVKYDFSDNESEQEGVFYEYFPKPKVHSPQKFNVTENLGRQTIDLNGPIYDPNLVPQKDNDTFSKSSKRNSEAEIVGQLLTQFGGNNFKGFKDSDLTASVYYKSNSKDVRSPSSKASKAY